jgi:large subunit ribosomal protein L23
MGKPAHQIIKRPLLTEKGTRLRETGGRLPGTITEDQVKPTVFFEVAPDANKIEIKQAIEARFQVRVLSVNTINVQGKLKRTRGILGRRNAWKKAVIRLVEGDAIKEIE